MLSDNVAPLYKTGDILMVITNIVTITVFIAYSKYCKIENKSSSYARPTDNITINVLL